MYIMNECYRYYPITIAFPRYSIFRNKFSDLIRSLQVRPTIRLFKIAKYDQYFVYLFNAQESGLTNKWYKEEMEKVAKITDETIKDIEMEPYTLRSSLMNVHLCMYHYNQGPYIKDVRKIFGFFDPLPPLVRILARAIRVNPRNLPYYVCFWATPLPPSRCGRPLCMAPKQKYVRDT